MELDAADRQRSSGMTCGLHRRLTGNPEVCLTDIPTRIQDHPKDRLEELLPWNWALANARSEAA